MKKRGNLRKPDLHIDSDFHMWYYIEDLGKKQKWEEKTYENIAGKRV